MDDGSFGKPINFIKGADIAIIERLEKGNKEKEDNTIALMDTFATKGLRTLMFAKRELPEKYDTP